MHRCASGCGASSCWRSTAWAGRPTRRADQRARTTLADELGIEPGSALRELESAILDQDDLRLRRGAGGDRPVVAIPAALDVAGSALVGRAAEVARLEAVWAATGAATADSSPSSGSRASARRASSPSREHSQRRPRDRRLRPLRHLASHGARVVRPGVAVGRQLLDAGPVRRAPGESLGTSIGSRLAAWAADTPVLLVLDDLHEADAEVLEVVSEVATGRPTRRSSSSRSSGPNRTTRTSAPRVATRSCSRASTARQSRRSARCTAPIGRPRTSTAYSSRAAASRSPCTKRRRRGCAAHRRDE